MTGAKGMVGVLDFPEPMARGAYYPFYGVELENLPGVFVDRDTGASLKSALATSPAPVSARLVLDATFAPAVSENVVAVVPGAHPQPEIVLSSHSLVLPGETPYPSIQIISAPACLLSAHLPEVTSQLTDYDLMRSQAIAVGQMDIDLAAHRWE